MNVLILKDNEAFSKLSSDKIAKQHFIAYGDGEGYYRIVKDRYHDNVYGAKVPAETIHWYISKEN